MIRRQAYFGFALLLILGAAALAIYTARELTEQDQSAEHTLTVRNALQRLQLEIQDAERTLRLYFLTDNDTYLQPYRSAPGKITAALQAVEALTSDNASQQRRIGELRPLIEDRLVGLAAMIRAHQANAPADEAAAISRGRQIMSRIGSILDAMTQEENQLYHARRDRVQFQARIVIIAFAVVVLVSLLMIGLVFHRMSAEVRLRRRAEEALRKLNAELEDRVQARTDELLRANAQLKDEIPERQRIAEAYRETSETLATIIESSPFAISCLAPDHTVLVWNRASERIFGYTADEVLGRPLPHVPEEGRAEYNRLFARARQGEALRDIRVTRRRKDGKLINISFNCAPLYDEAGALRGIIYTIEDITDRLSTEQQLRQAQKMEAVGQLTAGIAHDFNNLLTVIAGNLDLLAEHVQGEEPLSLASAAQSASFRGAELISRLLAFGRRQALQPQAVDCNKWLSEMITILRRTLGENIRISTLPGSALWPAFVDVSQLGTAILNLAINARDAMPEGGEVLIETGNVHLDEHYAAQNPDAAPGDYVMVAVSDNGTGMAPEVAEKAFEPFFTTKTVGAGSGLGLSMVYGFVRQSRGHVKIYTEPGRGTTVRLYLPRAAEPHATAPMQADPLSVEYPRGNETILLVEDSEAVRKIAVGMLKQLGYRVLEVENAPAALRLLADRPGEVDLLFSDVVMPGGMDGHELARRVRQSWPDIKILLASGYSEAFIRSGVLRRPSEQHASYPLLSKPYRIRELTWKVREALDGVP